ncbi:MAG: efflux RND transporter periplasmic adaptor subunit [Planctomycetes bacterium]|nr:efflux RND transporter periplasmic adaptor subunit [Planctomycetota bacterium]
MTTTTRTLGLIIKPTLLAMALSSIAWGADSDDHHPEPKAAGTANPQGTGSPHADAKGPAGKDDQDAKGTAEVKLTPEAVERFHITTYHVEPMVLREPILAPGTVSFVPETTTHIGTVVLGRVSAIHAHLGEVVKAGDPLITIDSPELGLAQNDWLQKRAIIAVSQADVNISEKAHERAQVLAKDHGISVSEAERREGDLLKAQANLVAAQAGVQAAENTMRIHGMDQAAIDALAKTGLVSTQLIIRAATTGTVISSGVTLGEVARPEAESLMTIADTSNLVVLVQVPANQAGVVTIGSSVRITAASMPGRIVESSIVYLSPQIDRETRTLQVRVPISGDAGLAAGTFVDVDISPAPKSGGKEAKIIAVPRDALFTVGTSTVVFVADMAHPGTYAMKKVAAAPPLGSLVPIISGVEDDDEVVVHGGFVIKAEFGKAGAKDED